jgi:hypothetical protein
LTCIKDFAEGLAPTALSPSTALQPEKATMKPLRPFSHHMRAISAILRRSRRALLARLQRVSALPGEQLAAGFSAAVADVERAFRREEVAMDTFGVAGLPAHRRDNACLLAALHHAESAVDGGNIELGRNALTALADLVALHRLTVDLALASARTPQAPRLRRLAAMAGAGATGKRKARRHIRV